MRKDYTFQVFHSHHHHHNSIHPLIVFSHVIPKNPELLSKMDTAKYGPLFIGSPLSFHLSALEFNFTVVTNLEPAVNLAQAYLSDICKVNLPYQFPDLPEAVHFNTAQENYIEHLRVTHQESTDNEKRTVKQRECDELPAFQQKKFKHGIKFEPVSRDKYYNVMKHYLRGSIT